jgi:predicted O-linked N-acetylglucosamine transferase (SPINDLY family)
MSNKSKNNPSQALFQQALALHQRGYLPQAREIYLNILKTQPNHFNSLHFLGLISYQTRDYKQAISLMNQAIELYSGDATFYCNLANSLRADRQLESAIENYNKAIALDPNNGDFYYNCANVLADLKRLDLALINYNKAIQLKPDYKFLFGMITMIKARICNWESYHEDKKTLENKILEREQAIAPFLALPIIDSPELQSLNAKTWVQFKYPSINRLGPIAKRSKGKKIRIGYYSADFYNHATSYLMAGLFESHDRSKFEIIAFSLGSHNIDEMHNRVSSSFDKFIDVSSKNESHIASLSRELEIDIAIDLKGFTQNMRLGAFAHRCAPIQVNYLGYPGTIGAPYMDYIIADKTIIPEESQKYYSEKIVYLPNSYQVNDSKRKISDKIFTKEEFGLPKDKFIYCCFNNSYKITPQTFDGWMKILNEVQESVLWLLEDNITATKNLKKEAANRGIDPNRLIFSERIPLEEHLARHKLADLFIDTVPCNAHTTCSDSLWAGLPVLTLTTKSFAGRVSASLLNAIMLPELITDTQEQYEALAIELSRNKEKLEKIKKKLVANKLSTSLFNTSTFTKNIEKAYEVMYEKYCEDIVAANIEI